MNSPKILFTLFLLLIGFYPIHCNAAKNPMIKATVVDVKGAPVKGAYLFFYDSPDTRRAVDLVSPVTNDKGYCEKAIPPGTYWVLARLKSNESFDMGPLMIEDKFSGDALEIEVAVGQELELEFIVMDLLDTIKTKSKKRHDLNKVSGTVVNDKGELLAGVFAFANRHQSPLSVPDYFSAWTEADGAFVIYLPNGKYNLGAALSLTDKQRYKAVQEIVVDKEVGGVTLLLAEKNAKEMAKGSESD